MINLNLMDIDSTSKKVDEDLFGGNYLFHRQEVENFKQISSDFNLSGVRYPGGSIIENFFDINNPDEEPEGLDEFGKEFFTGLTDFLSACNELGINPTIVIPTKIALLEDRSLDGDYIADVKAFVTDILGRVGPGKEFPNIKIDAFEIGNEYWGSGGMTSSEYGEVANAMTVTIQDAINGQLSSSGDPDILVQMGSPVKSSLDFKEGGIFHNLSPGSEEAKELGLTDKDFLSNGDLTWSAKLRVVNEQIIDNLSPEARNSIDGLVEHYYYDKDTEANPELAYRSDTTNFIDIKKSFWEKAGIDEKLNITEWNVHSDNYDRLGQLGASTIVSQLRNLVLMDADRAHIWPLQHNTSNDLAGDFRDEVSMSPIGGAFALLAKLTPGYELLEEVNGTSDLDIASFQNDRSFHHFISSLVESDRAITFKLPSDFEDSAGIKVTRLYADSDGQHWVKNAGYQDVEWYLDNDAKAVIEEEIVTPNQDGEVSISLRPFEMIVISYETEQEIEPIEFWGTDARDVIDGLESDDQIYGLKGNDALRGWGGRDSIYGGEGDDRIFGDGGDDLLLGEDGGDRIMGGEGDDTLQGENGSDFLKGEVGNDIILTGNDDDIANGGGGNDFIDGGAGNDVLWGGKGHDTIFGSAGNDTIGGGVGIDSLKGGLGNDTLWGDWGNDIINGEAGADLLNGGEGDDTILGGTENDTLWGANGNDILDGGEGSDFIHGGAGNDTLVSGSGTDTLVGGVGADHYFFTDGATGVGRIKGLDVSERDTLKIAKDLLDDDLRDLSIKDILSSIQTNLTNGNILLKFSEDFSIIIENCDDPDSLDEVMKISF